MHLRNVCKGKTLLFLYYKCRLCEITHFFTFSALSEAYTQIGFTFLYLLFSILFSNLLIKVPSNARPSIPQLSMPPEKAFETNPNKKGPWECASSQLFHSSPADGLISPFIEPLFLTQMADICLNFFTTLTPRKLSFCGCRILIILSSPSVLNSFRMYCF